MISGGSLTLDDVKASVLEALAVNAPYMSTAKDIEYKIEDCQKGAKDFSGNINVTVTGDYISGQDDVLTNSAASPATNAAVTVVNTDGTRVRLLICVIKPHTLKPQMALPMVQLRV